jgi:hypothetical protein
MSTYLELFQQLHRDVGAAGTEPAGVTGLAGEAKRLANWIIQADNYVQLKYVNWKFLRAEFSVPTVASQATLAKPTGLKYWDFKTFTVIDPGETDKNPFDAIEYDKTKRDILDTSEGPPWRAIVMPDNSLKFEPVPDDTYTIGADYYLVPTLLAANSDESTIPPEYHQIIIGRAMILYANFESAPEIKDQGEEIYTELLALLENDQLPNQEHARFNTGATIEVIAE